MDYKIKAESGNIFAKPDDPLLNFNKQLKIHRDKDDVVLELDGKFLKMPHQIVKQVATCMVKVAMVIEKEKQVITDVLKG